jgi:hypothetical protein
MGPHAFAGREGTDSSDGHAHPGVLLRLMLRSVFSLDYQCVTTRLIGEYGQIKDITDMAALRASHEVRVIVDGEGDKKRKRKLYDCFISIQVA